MATFQLLRLQCLNPATSFGDDISIQVDGEPAGGEFGIDKGQTHDLSQFVFPDLDEDTVAVTVFEDGDHAADLEFALTAGRKRKEFPVKEGGFYRMVCRAS